MIKCSVFILDKERWDQYGTFYPGIPTIRIIDIRNNYLSDLKSRIWFWTGVRFQPISILLPSVEPDVLTKVYYPISRPNVNIFSENFMQLLYGHLNGLLSRFKDRIVLTLDAPILRCSSLGVDGRGAFDFVKLGYRRLTK